MQKHSAVCSVLTLLLLYSTALGAQEPQAQPSLGDVARQIREDKEKSSAQPKTVITDETVQSKKGQSAPAGPGGQKNAAIYFVPIGDAPSSEISDLAAHYRAKFDIQPVVLPQMEISRSDVDVSRHQLIAEEVIESLNRLYSGRLKNTPAILIGITGHDMYPRGEDWEFCFGWRDPDTRIAVVSTARMNLHYQGEPADQANSRTRLRKVVTKDIGVMYFGMSTNHNPRSVLFDSILGIEELDQVSENF